MIKYQSTLALCFALCFVACGEQQSPPHDAQPAQEQPATSPAADSRPGNHDDLIVLQSELVDWRPFSPVDGVIDYSAERIAKRVAEIDDMQARLARIDVQGWSVSQQVDYLTVRAELD